MSYGRKLSNIAITCALYLAKTESLSLRKKIVTKTTVRKLTRLVETGVCCFIVAGKALANTNTLQRIRSGEAHELQRIRSCARTIMLSGKINSEEINSVL